MAGSGVVVSPRPHDQLAVERNGKHHLLEIKALFFPGWDRKNL